MLRLIEQYREQLRRDILIRWDGGGMWGVLVGYPSKVSEKLCGGGGEIGFEKERKIVYFL